MKQKKIIGNSGRDIGFNNSNNGGFNLSNKNNGGGGPLTHSENVVKKIMKDKNFIEIGKKISKAKFGAKYNITIRGKDHPLFGIKQTYENIEKRRLGHIGVKPLPYRVRKDKGIKKTRNIRRESFSIWKKIQ